MKSILTDDLEHCMRCGSNYIEMHHVMFGTADRKLSDKYGLIVPLCPWCHRSNKGVHQDREFDLKLREFAQRKFETAYPDEDWMKIFGRNYK